MFHRIALALVLIAGALALALAISTPATAGPPILPFIEGIPAATSDALTVRIAAPLTIAPTRLTSTSISDAAWAEFPATDIGLMLRKTDVAQMLVVTNFDAAARICIDTPVRTNADCAVDCAALTSTCSGAATDGDIVLPGQSREFRPSGLLCMCYRASAANADAQLSAVVR